MVWYKRLISTLLILVGMVCLLNIIDLPYEIRFVEAQFNYLFFGGLYVTLAVLVLLRFFLIEDVYIRRTLLIVASMLIVFPCMFVFSISLQQFYRVKNAAGVDAHQILVNETQQNDTFIREYSVPDQGFAETYGFGVSSKTQRSYQISHSSQRYFPTKKITREERALGQYLKVVRLIQG